MAGKVWAWVTGSGGRCSTRCQAHTSAWGGVSCARAMAVLFPHATFTSQKSEALQSPSRGSDSCTWACVWACGRHAGSGSEAYAWAPVCRQQRVAYETVREQGPASLPEQGWRPEHAAGPCTAARVAQHSCAAPAATPASTDTPQAAVRVGAAQWSQAACVLALQPGKIESAFASIGTVPDSSASYTHADMAADRDCRVHTITCTGAYSSIHKQSTP